MRVLLIGDVVGRPGRRVVREHVPLLKTENHIDLIVANVENAASGAGLTPATAEELFAAGIDVMTSGNHIFDRKEVLNLMEHEPRLLRPANYAPQVPGRGIWTGTTVGGHRVCVINLQGRIFMAPSDCPFRTVDRLLEQIEPQIVLVDMHAEATSEKIAMGWYLDGRVSAVFGTHTHVQTADETILPGGTAYITDLGMTGPYDGIIGMQRDLVLDRFLRGMPARFEPAVHDVRLCGAIVEISDETYRAVAIERIMLRA
ncbi:MAG: TIGR00282 family metallophosphoesterase [Acidobacteriota bacterium]|nr:TIGR00282 family metallophosphoesterase [Blastocatellia bacterium]MDW8239278.1 TIGR00282 family metallophosphoesterase [Acidobacteriota bacterium]